MFEGLLQPTHLVLILAIALIVLGPGKLGDLGGQLGRGVREFRQNMDGADTRVPSLGPGSARFCSACGARADGSAAFCGQCGARTSGGGS